MSKLICLIIIALLITLVSRAQSFRVQATADAVRQSGFHRILLPPDVVGHLNASLADIRLYDGRHQEVPYRLIRQAPLKTTYFIDYEVVSKQSRAEVGTTLVIRNRAKNRINSLEIVVRNTNVGKKARLSGSPDARSWYALDNAIWLEPSQNTTTTTDSKRLQFPLSDYEYYRLEVNDSLSTPLNILRAGYYIEKASGGTYSSISGLTVSQRDSSNKRTYVHITRSTTARFDRLRILVQGSTPFRRRAELGQFHTKRLKRGRLINWFEPIRSIELSSLDSNEISLASLKAKDLYLVIDNADNPPLVVRTVRAYQLTTYLLANLTTSASPYTLKFSADDVATPVYDMTPFKGNTTEYSPIIYVREIKAIDTAEPKTAFFVDSWIIWPALGIVLLLLGFLSYQMLQEMGKVNQKSN